MNEFVALSFKSSVVLIVALCIAAACRHASAATSHTVWAAGLGAALLLPLAAGAFRGLDISGFLNPATLTYRSPLPLPDWIALHSPLSGETATLSRQLFWVALLWASGAMVVVLRFAAGARHIRRLTRDSEALSEAEWTNLVSALSERLTLKRPVRLRLGRDGVPPLTWGFLRSTILLPAAALTWTSKRRRSVLAHELGHIQRRDSFFQLLMTAATSLYWFNPIAWYGARRMRVERELACDDIVLNLQIGAEDYATDLLQIAGSVARMRGFATLAMAAHPSDLEARVRAILDASRNRVPFSRRLSLLLFGVMLLLITSLAATRLTALPALPAGGEPSRSAASQQAMASVFMKWLDEDVVYIASPEERSAFLSLNSDEEREQFIEQFWLRRDPTPDTARNEYRDEHYERIAFVNSRFVFSKPGWQSDRGHMYIVYGKPDEIESHPGGAGTYTFPWEVWTYRYIEGLGDNVMVTFIDPERSGEYRLARPFQFRKGR